MSIVGYDTKIIAGKLRKIPIYSNNNAASKVIATPYWANNSGETGKIGNKYSVIPPITDQKHDHLSSDSLAQRVTDALTNVSRAKLENIRLTFHRLDTDRSGRITTKELNDVFLLYSIFILGPTLQSLIKRFEAKGGGVMHQKLWNFLEECHTAVPTDRGKLNGHISNPTVNSYLNQQASKTDDENKLLEDLEKQLHHASREIDLRELKLSFENCDRGLTGCIGFKEMKWFCQHHKLPISPSLLERLLNKFDLGRDGWVQWKDFVDFLEKAMLKTGGPKNTGKQGQHQQQVNRNSSNLTSSTQTQTNTGQSLVIRHDEPDNDKNYERHLPVPDPSCVNIRGRKVYVYPSDDLADVDSPAEPPNEKPVLEWVYGYRGRDCRNNLFVLKSDELIYFTAAVVVMLNRKKLQQRHYIEHTDDIKSLSVHPDGVTIATGQVAGHEKVQGEPHIRIWDSHTLQTKMVIGLGYFERAVVSLAFSTLNGVDQGRYLVSVDDNDYHTISLWDWAKNKKIADARGHMDQVLVAEFSPYDNRQLVSCGKQHVSFWALDDDNKLKCDRGRFDTNVKPKYISCLTFSKDGDVITGDTNGTIFFWPEGSNQISISVKNAHDGPIYSLLVLSSGILLSAGGRDGIVRAWDRRLQPMGVQLKFPRNVTGIRTLAVDEHNSLYAGTVNNSIWCTELATGLSPLLDVGTKLKTLIEGHTDDLRGLATHPSSTLFITAGGDKTLKLWNAKEKAVVWSARLPAPALAADFNPREELAAIGHKDGSFAIVQSSTGELLTNKKCSKEKISELKFSPDGVYLAIASHDNNIYIFKLSNGGKSIELLGKCTGHTSFVTHLDWSADSTQLQSTSGDYELLFWDALKCDRITSSESMRNTDWKTHNCILGYPVLGIWPSGSDGTDINAVDKSHAKRLLATADDFGDVNLFSYPCSNTKAKPHVAKGHSAHVTCVRFLHDDSRLISVGGRDASIMQWKIVN